MKRTEAGPVRGGGRPAAPTRSRDVLQGFQPPVRAELAARAAAFDPVRTPPVPPRRAASVVLLREDGGPLETYLLHRHARMTFAAEMVVFPGGGLDAGDLTAPDPWRAAGVRETAEETGVRLRRDDLLDWAHWTTPEPEPRRFDTRFFVAALPSGERAADISGETTSAAWTAPDEALRLAAAGTLALMPPTLSILMELAAARTLAAVRQLAAGRVVEPVLPRLVRRGEDWAYDYGMD